MSGAPHLSVDFLGADAWSALGDTPVLLVEAEDFNAPAVPVQAVVVGLDRAGQLPAVDPGLFDVLLTTAADPPAPWVAVPAARLDAQAQALAGAMREWPMAATVLCQVLRIGEHLPFGQALTVESLAYSALLGGSEFARWHAGQAPVPHSAATGEPVRVAREGDLVTLTLDQPERQNAMTAAMRDALYAALATTLDDPSAPQVLLQGAGKCFSSGGELGEFGTATDLAGAHVVRTLRSCAGLLDRLGERARVRLHGACIGAGLEVPAAAARREALADAWFQLPELRMGLIPGAGGTASVTRAIGRHRTSWMVLSGKRIDVRTALAWGLVHEIVE